ncbi:MAG: hypothetical protein ACREB2_09995 [Pseudolabrys sp.]
MCHHVHVILSAEDKKEARKLAGVMIPIYASVVLAVIAVVAVSSTTRQGELIASTSAPAVR